MKGGGQFKSFIPFGFIPHLVLVFPWRLRFTGKQSMRQRRVFNNDPPLTADSLQFCARE